MRECWLQTNRRALLLGLVFPGLMFACGLAAATLPAALMPWWPLRWLGGGLALLAAWMLAALLYQCTQPRVAREHHNLLVYLRAGPPFRVPLAAVECFFLGQSSGAMRGPGSVEPEVATIVVRLAEGALEYHNRSVKPQLGNWCDGYIMIRGTWCEPITSALLKQLNGRLAAWQREQKSQATAPA